MRRLLIAAALAALVLAKPELYKETEDFQYSRSSSDDGSKSGFYGSQRGNMGGNYEKAHNMDGLAQHQMSGLVRTVDGELGDGYKTRTGSVYTAANSRGIYGSGNYDLSNLQGRNFEETESFGGASQHSSSMSQSVGYRDRSSMNSDAYGNSLTHNSGYRQYQAGTQSADQLKSEDNLQSADRLHSAHGYGYGSQDVQFSNSGFQSHHAYDQSNANSRHSSAYGSNSRIHMLPATPVRVVVRPGTRVTVPLTAQTYDANRATTLENERINTDAELLTTSGQQSNIAVNAPKHYESSYSYRKKWEKHDTQPIALDAIPTVNPFASQSDLLEANQAVGLETGQQRSVNSYNSQASNAAYAANTKSAASSQSRYQAGFNTQHSSSSGLSSNGYSTGSHASNDRIATIGTDSANLVELLNTKPKSYHSSYSYHKAWERQGDPYVIQPVGGSQIGQTSQKLTAASLNQGAYSSHHYGSQYNQAHQSFSHNGVDCDDEGHVRLARSYDPNQEQQFETYQNFGQDQEEFGQQSQSRLENLEDLGQQVQGKWDNLQDLGQQTQEQWGNLEQQNQHQWDNLQNLDQQEEQEKFEKLEDLGQQTETKFDHLEDFGQQSQSQLGNTQDLGQHIEEKENLGQQMQDKWDNLQDLSHQTQEQWGNLEQQNQHQWDNLQNLGQQTQDKNEKLEDLGQQTETKFNQLEDFGQQSQSQLANAQDLGQHQEEKNNLEQQMQGKWDNLQDLSHQTQEQWGNLEQQNQHQWDNLQNLGQQQDKFDKLEDLGQQTNFNQFEDLGQQSQSQWDSQQTAGQISQIQHNDINNLGQQPSNIWDKLEDLGQQSQTTLDNTQQNMQNIWEQQDNHSQQTQSILEHQPQAVFGHGLEEPKEQTFLNFHQQLFHHNQNTIYSKETSEQNSFWTQFSEQNNYQHNFQANTDQEIDTKIPTSLSGLWDKIDSIANKTLSRDDDDNMTHKQTHEDLPSWTQNQNTYGSHTYLSNNAGAHKKVLSTTESVITTHSVNKQPNDIGRGDIGPEDTHSTSDTSDMSHINQSYKTPQEIEALSLTQKLNESSSNQDLENQSTNSDWLSILNLDDEKFIEELRKQIEMEEEKRTLKPMISTTPKSSNLNIPRASISNQLNHKTQDIDTSLNEQHLEQQFTNFDQQQQTQELQKSQLEDFGQQMQSSWHPEEHLQQTVNVPLNQFSQEPAPVKFINLKDPSENPENNQSSQETVKNTNIEFTYPSTTPLHIHSETEEPGFWKKVGNKFSNAKNTVYSWFHSS